MNKQKQLWDRLAEENSKYYINSDYGRDITDDEFSESGYEDYIRFIFDDPIIQTGEIFLEIGCGTGRMTQYIAQDWSRIYAVDISAKMIKEATKKLSFIKNIQFITTDGNTFPIKDNSIDAAFSYLVFQHIKTKEMIESNFREVYRVLRNRGVFKVRVRTDKVDLDKWWGGIACDEKYPLSIGFKLLRKEEVEDYGLWLWLRKS